MLLTAGYAGTYVIASEVQAPVGFVTTSSLQELQRTYEQSKEWLLDFVRVSKTICGEDHECASSADGMLDILENARYKVYVNQPPEGMYAPYHDSAVSAAAAAGGFSISMVKLKP